MALQNMLGDLALDATLTNHTQVSQIVNAAGDAVTVTGNKLDVNASVTIDTSLLATSAKQLPDGHTVALSAIDNAVLDTIDAVLDVINAKMVTGTDIGDVTINNAAGANAVNIQDGGNSITVDGTFYQATQPVSIASMPSTPVTNAGTFAVQIPVVTGIGHGVKTVTTAGTDVALAASTACKKVTIQAQLDNTSAIAVGGSGVDATVATGTGIVLNPGDAYEFEIDNLADIYIDSLVSGEGVRFTYFT